MSHEDLINQIQYLKQRIERELSFTHLDMVHNVLPVLRNMELVLGQRPKPIAWMARRADWPEDKFEPFKFKPEWASQAFPLYSSLQASIATPQPQSVLPPIDYDADMDRYYIPLPGEWEMQTKGKGSTFRLAKTDGSEDRWPILETRLHEPLEQLARAVHAALIEPPSALAIDAAAKMQAAEVCEGRRDSLAISGMVSASGEASKCAAVIRATIPQDGITDLEEFGMKCVSQALQQVEGLDQSANIYFPDESECRVIVTSLIGDKK